MSEFQREERYIVIKINKLAPGNPGLLNKLLMQIPLLVGKEALTECVVVEKDWSIYEETWDNVQGLAEGRESIKAEAMRIQAENTELKQALSVVKRSPA